MINPYNPALEPPVPPAQQPPRELAKVSLPSYRIEPPDILQIEMLKLVPLPPYRAEVFDVLQVRVANTLVDQPIDNYFMIEAEGTINLGPAYGTVRVVGMTIDEIKQAIDQQAPRGARAARRSRCNWRGSRGPSRSPASTWSAPTARSTCGSTGWSTWRARR